MGLFHPITYLPRLVRREVLDGAIEQSLSAVLVDNERFAIASGKDAETGRYRGLLVAPNPNTRIQVTDSTLLIDTARAQKQVDADRIAAAREASASAATADSDSARSVRLTSCGRGSSSVEGGELFRQSR